MSARTHRINLLMVAAVGSALVIGTVFATGQTFGQRCAKAYPNQPERQADCTSYLSRSK